MKFLVTGAGGFVGAAFCRAALAAGHEVQGLIRNPDVVLPHGCQRLSGSLEDVPWGPVEKFEPDVLLHLAWIVGPRDCLQSPVNERLLLQSESLFRGCLRRGVRHLAGTGTCIEYAPSDLPLSEETSPLGPIEQYSKAKVAVSQRLRLLAEDAGVSWAWFRIFYCYGESEHPDRLCPSVCRALLAGKDVILKNPDSVRDYLHVDDVATALLASMVKGLNGTTNVGRGSGISIRDLACEIARSVGSDISHLIHADPPVHDPRPVIVADVTKLQTIEWRPAVGLREGLDRLYHSLMGMRG